MVEREQPGLKKDKTVAESPINMPFISELLQRYQVATETEREVVNKFINAILKLDKNTRDAFVDIMSEKRYGSFTFVFKAGECVGFDWKSSHRTHKT